ncbi:MAG: hypothetical protein ACI80N_003936 [Gammaproteobacteria bacterium]|jgi:hypothetical protein
MTRGLQVELAQRTRIASRWPSCTARNVTRLTESSFNHKRARCTGAGSIPIQVSLS